MTDIKIAKTEAPFHAQEGGIDVGFLELEANAATGIVVTTVSTDSTDIIFDYQLAPPTEAAVLAVVQAHDGRTKATIRTVSLGIAAFHGFPNHRSHHFSTSGDAQTVVEKKLDDGDFKLLGGRLWIGPEAKFGDKVKIALVDVDGVVIPGIPPGTPLSTPVREMHIPPGGTGQGFMTISSGQAIPILNNTYLQFTYNASGSDGDVQIIAYWTEIHDAP